MSLNSKIARNQNDDLFWGSKEDKLILKKRVCETGVVIMGKNTFFNTPPGFFQGFKTYVLSSSATKLKQQYSNPEIEFTNSTPENLLQHLFQLGQTRVICLGGAITTRYFFQKGLIDFVEITLTGKVFPDGIDAFKDLNLELKLLNFKCLNSKEIRLIYQVIK